MTTHHVHSSKFNISVVDTAQALQARQKIKEFVQYELEPIFESVFDILPETQTLHIPKLEINLGNIDLNNLENILKTKLNEKLMESLLLLLKQQAELGVAGMNKSVSDTEISVQNGRSLYADPSGKIVADSFEGFSDPNTLLIHYLEHGRLPWYTSEAGIVAFNNHIGEIKTQYSIFIQYLNTYSPESVEYMRILNLISNRTWLQWLHFEPTEIDDFFAFFRTHFNSIEKFKIQDSQKVIQELEQRIQRITKNLILQNNPPPVIRTWKDFFTHISTQKSAEFQQIEKSIHLLSAINFSSEIHNNKWVEALIELTKIKKAKTSPKDTEVNTTKAQENTVPPDKKAFKAPKYRQENESFLIDDAGIILLWPFLSQLFAHLLWFNKETGEFTDENAQNKASVFLHYLANNTLPETENKLVLCKIICGIDIDAPLNLDYTFNAEEIETGNELLTAAAKHWTALRTESAEALQNEFFFRKGILKFTDPNWSLTIERKSIDILIDRLPWSISNIKLPWNSYILNTTW
ncbi:MAG: hypothetical protein IT244_09525 [Bacteroidia bacterium]|jgi:hypothetical protein|nr:hypothetical protein [Bacteroidia bacterium]